MKEFLMKKRDYNKILWAVTTIAIIIFDFIVFYNAEGTGDIQGFYVPWVENVYKYGLREGFVHNADMYPPLSTLVMYLSSRLFSGLSIVQAIRCADLICLAVTGLWIICKFNKPEIGFGTVLLCLVSVQLGYIDVLVFPFIVIAIYFLWKERYYLFALSFTFAVGMKMQPLIIAPFLALYFVYVQREKPYINIPVKKILKMGACVLAVIVPIVLFYGIEEMFAFVHYGFNEAGFSDYALNFLWIVQYIVERFFPSKGVFLTDGIPDIIWAPQGKLLLFKYVFWIIFIALCVFALFLKYKSTAMILKLCIIEYTAYFMFTLSVHENHLILAMILACLLVCVEDNFINRWIMVVYGLVVNVNIMIFYGWVGGGYFENVVIGRIPNTVWIAMINTVVLGCVCLYLIVAIVLEERAHRRQDCPEISENVGSGV